jgi:hypothetical protein
MYSWRREALTTFARNLTIDQAKEIALHQPKEADTSQKYDFGFGDLDIAAIRLGELLPKGADSVRNRIREFLASPALNRLSEYPKQDQELYARSAMRDHADVVGFDDALSKILQALAEKFQCPMTTIRSVQATLDDFPPIENYVLPFEDTRQSALWVDHLSSVSNGSEAREYFRRFLLCRNYCRRWVRRHFREE